MARGEHVLPVLIVLKGARLANQRIDHVAVVDGMLACTDQAGHSLDQYIAVPDLDEVGIDPRLDLVSDQTAGNGIGVLLDSDRAVAVNLDAAELRSVIQSRGRQLAKHFLFLLKPRGA